ADIGDELELELQRPRFAIFAGLIFARRLMRGRHEIGVALTAAPAAGDDDAIAVLEHFAEPLLGVDVLDHGADWHGHDYSISGAAALVGAGPVIAGWRGPRVAIRVVEQRRQIRIADDDDVAAATSVPSIGPTHGHELLASERDDARSAVACLHPHHDPIDE